MLLSICEACYSILERNRGSVIRFVPGKYILVSACLSVFLLVGSMQPVVYRSQPSEEVMTNN